MTATSKRTRAAADFLQQSVKKAKASAPVTTTSSSAPVLPAVSDSLAALHAIIYPEGKKKAAHELTPFQRRVYAITRRIPAGPSSHTLAGRCSWRSIRRDRWVRMPVRVRKCELD